MRQQLRLDSNSRVVIIATEGATDPEVYRNLVGVSPETVLEGTNPPTNGIGRLQMADCVLQTLIPDIEHLAETKVAKYRLPRHGTRYYSRSGARLVRWVRRQADLDSGKKPTENTIARIASVTKTFTTTAIMQLRDEGRLTLEDSLAQHIPEFASARAIPWRCRRRDAPTITDAQVRIGH